MGKAKKTRKFAAVKRVLNLKQLKYDFPRPVAFKILSCKVSAYFQESTFFSGPGTPVRTGSMRHPAADPRMASTTVSRRLVLVLTSSYQRGECRAGHEELGRRSKSLKCAMCTFHSHCNVSVHMCSAPLFFPLFPSGMSFTPALLTVIAEMPKHKDVPILLRVESAGLAPFGT
jgi:hypothetical protein